MSSPWLRLAMELPISRQVARYEPNDRTDFCISTIYAEDTKRYETAVFHPEFWPDKDLGFKCQLPCIVGFYDTRQKAVKHHHRWVKVFVNPKSALPKRLPHYETWGVNSKTFVYREE